MSTFPSVLSTISDPQATDKLNSPSHSSIESSQNDAISKLETFVGTLSSAAGTLMYDIRATASDGGGHVQSANKGGTGQTSFTKGDVLVAQSSSVISKLAVGTNNQVLTADSAQNTGVKWAGVANAEDIQNQTFTYGRASVMSGSVFGIVLSQSPSILSDGLGLVVKIPAAPATTPVALQVHTTSSGSVSALIKKQNLDDPATADMAASTIGVFEFDSVSSVFQMVTPVPSITSLPYVDTTSAQSVAGVKVFGSIPQTEGGNPSADNELARKAYVDDLASSFANGTETFSSSSVIGVSVGFAVRNVRIHAVTTRSAAAVSPAFSNGGWASTAGASNCVFVSHDDNGNTQTTGTSDTAYYIQDGNNPGSIAGTVSSVTATGFLLTAVKQGTTNDAKIFWEAQA